MNARARAERRQTWALLATSLGFGVVQLIGLFVFVEHPRDEPMLPLTLFSSRTSSLATTIGLPMNIAFYGLIFLLSLGDGLPRVGRAIGRAGPRSRTNRARYDDRVARQR